MNSNHFLYHYIWTAKQQPVLDSELWGLINECLSPCRKVSKAQLCNAPGICLIPPIVQVRQPGRHSSNDMVVIPLILQT